MSDPALGAPSRGRRWLQFRIRSLFVLVLISASALALWNLTVAPYWKQQKALLALKQSNARYTAEAVGPAWLGELTGAELFVDVIRVDIRSQPIKSSLVTELAALQGLRQLKVQHLNEMEGRP